MLITDEGNRTHYFVSNPPLLGMHTSCDLTQTWSMRVAEHKLKSRSLDEEKVYAGDEHGLQRRFQQSVGQVVGAALEAHSAGIKCDLILDCALISTDTNELQMLEAVGELKVPWVGDHDVLLASGLDKDFRHLLSQIIRYMLKLQMKYGWISNYEQTIFLRQTCVGDTWGIEYSPIIKSTDGYTKNPLRVSVR